jgi:recombinational DNA repair protein (RecF pathway)
VRLLALVGFAPRFDRCGRCGKQPLPNQAAEFDPPAGYLVCRGCGGASQRIAAGVRAELLHAGGPDWLAAGPDSLSKRDLLDAREAIDRFIEYRVGKALRAQALTRTESKES